MRLVTIMSIIDHLLLALYTGINPTSFSPADGCSPAAPAWTTPDGNAGNLPTLQPYAEWGNATAWSPRHAKLSYYSTSKHDANQPHHGNPSIDAATDATPTPNATAPSHPAATPPAEPLLLQPWNDVWWSTWTGDVPGRAGNGDADENAQTRGRSWPANTRAAASSASASQTGEAPSVSGDCKPRAAATTLCQDARYSRIATATFE